MGGDKKEGKRRKKEERKERKRKKKKGEGKEGRRRKGGKGGSERTRKRLLKTEKKRIFVPATGYPLTHPTAERATAMALVNKRCCLI